MQHDHRNSARLFFLPYVCVFTCLYLWLFPAGASAQEEVSREVAVNLAEGRVVICAAKDGIIAATVFTQGEAGSRAPVIVPLGATRMGILLGAVDWVQPDSSDKPVRLDSELARLVRSALDISGRPDYENAASDIEAVGVAMLERIRQLAGQFHHKLELGEDDPLIRLILIGNVPNYGPEAWSIDYFIRQDTLGNDYWQTRVLRPSYNQLYPPEKGKPHTFVEVRFPPANRATQTPELLDLLRQDDPRLAKIRASSAPMGISVSFVVDGQSQKSKAAADADFLRAALPAVTQADAKVTMANVDFENGFQWLIEPPAAERPPVDTTPREPDAPTLRRKSTN